MVFTEGKCDDMHKREQAREDLMAFLATIVRPGIDPSSFSDETNLIDEGIIDSLAVIQIICYLEQSHGINLQATGVDPNDLGTVSGILGVIEQAGR